MKFQIETLESVTSTQDVLKARAVDGAAEGTVIHALRQSAGRGRHGRVWVSEAGNLYLSILLRPSCPVSEIGRISLLTAVALADVIVRYLDDPAVLTLKWPNDLLFDARKGAGILLESDVDGDRVNWVAVGVGVNLVSALPDIGDALSSFSAKALDMSVIRDEFLEAFAALYDLSFDDIRQKWLGYSYAPGTQIGVKIGERLESGVFHDIDGYGNLRLAQADGSLKTITSGDVYVTGD